MTLTVKHASLTGAAANPNVLVDGPKWDAEHTITGSVDATQMPALTGDVTTPAGSTTTTLATVNANVGTFGSATQTAQVTFNAKGLATAASNVTVTPAIGSVTGLGTGVATFLATPSSANLRAALTDEVGTGAAYFVGGALGTPASGTLTSCTAFNLTTTGSSGAATYSAGTLNIPQYSGVSNFAIAPGGRITLASGVPVMATSQAGATTVYYTPYAGNLVPIYDGTNMTPTAFSELSQATTDSTKSPAAVAASKVYDLFVWNDSGTIRCTRGPAWTNATTRGYTLTMVSGVLLNTSSITNGPAASRGTWVGTIASNASSTIDFIFGAPGSGGVAGVFNVWNAYNRVTVGTTVVDTGASYSYTSSTWRQARASTGMQVSFVVGSSEDAVIANNQNVVQLAANASAVIRLGIGYDSVTTPANNNAIGNNAAVAMIVSPNTPYLVPNPAIGTHYLSAMENADGANGGTFNLGGAVSTSGFEVMLRM